MTITLPQAAALAACLAILAPTRAAPETPASPSGVLPSKAAELVAGMTLEEKVTQLINISPDVNRVGIPFYNWWTESLHGAIGPVPTTVFPEPIGLAATFDAPLVKSVAKAIGTEVRALHDAGRARGAFSGGLNTWSPNINIYRDPRWGRGQETYGEDPFLTATLGSAFIAGLQGPDPARPLVIATPKHFAVHSGPESTRHSANVVVSPHDLEDTYLPAFRAAIVDARAGSVMCAYNRVNGEPACASHDLLQHRLRDAWGFKGYVVSDCDAVRDVHDGHKFMPDGASAAAASLKAGMDNECHTGAWGESPKLRQRYIDAVKRGLLTEADIDRAVTRLVAARLATGDLPGGVTRPAVPASAIDSAEHRALALRSAIESLVLLKNDGTLPLKPGVRIALVGPHGDSTRVLRGNYSSDRMGEAVSLLDGLREALPQARIRHVPFTPSVTDGDPVPPSAFLTPDGQPGLRAEYFKGAGDGFEAQPAATRTESHVVSNADLAPAVGSRHKIVWTGYLVPPETGRYRLSLFGIKGEVATDAEPVRADSYGHWGEPPRLVDVTLQKGHRYALRLEGEPGVAPAPGLLWKRVNSGDHDAELKAAVAEADVVVASLGLTSDIEGEEMPVAIEGFSGGDRTSLALPADQRRLLELAKSLGKPVVVVLMNGGALDLAWAKANAAAILEAWYPGQAGGRALARVLSGQADPGGRLPLTFYGSVDDLPPFDDYSMKGRTYRYYAGEPVYRFGHGLSYASYRYDALTVKPMGRTADAGLEVRVTLRNTSGRAGDEVAQVYLQPPAFDGAPRLALRGVQRVSLQPGEVRELRWRLSPRDLSFVNAAGERRLLPGRYKLSVGGGQPGAGVETLSSTFDLSSNRALPQ
jgi:beta-glucosidase